MREKQRYWYAFAIILLFLVVSVGVSGWIWSRYQASQQTAPAHKVVGSVPGTGTPTMVVQTPTPTAQKHPLFDMQKGVQLVIPSINLKAPVEMVGLDKYGRMEIPHENQWEHVGWYRNGPVPGQRGSAVIDGHLDRPGGSPAVFWDLHKLRVGDSVLIEDGKGQTLHFRVYKIEKYTPDAAPIKQIFADTSGTYLNLITCAGQWLPAEQQTTHRLVVYTKLE